MRKITDEQEYILFHTMLKMRQLIHAMQVMTQYNEVYDRDVMLDLLNEQAEKLDGIVTEIDDHADVGGEEK